MPANKQVGLDWGIAEKRISQWMEERCKEIEGIEGVTKEVTCGKLEYQLKDWKEVKVPISPSFIQFTSLFGVDLLQYQKDLIKEWDMGAKEGDSTLNTLIYLDESNLYTEVQRGRISGRFKELPDVQVIFSDGEKEPAIYQELRNLVINSSIQFPSAGELEELFNAPIYDEVKKKKGKEKNYPKNMIKGRKGKYV